VASVGELMTQLPRNGSAAGHRGPKKRVDHQDLQTNCGPWEEWWRVHGEHTPSEDAEVRYRVREGFRQLFGEPERHRESPLRSTIRMMRITDEERLLRGADCRLSAGRATRAMGSGDAN